MELEGRQWDFKSRFGALSFLCCSCIRSSPVPHLFGKKSTPLIGVSCNCILLRSDIDPPPPIMSTQREPLNPAHEQKVAAKFGCVLKTAHLNGIRIRYAEAQPTPTATNNFDAEKAPLVFFVHGWPESWYSWRHQLRALSAAGFRCVAPDMRGYGGTSSPKVVHDYNVYALAGDALALVHHLGFSRCVLVGHDWGAWLTWHLALLHPAVFTTICAMSVPYGGYPKVPLLTALRKTYGNETDRKNAKFQYMLHHNLPGSGAQYDADIRDALYRIYTFLPGIESDMPEVKSSKLYIPAKAAGVDPPQGAADDLVPVGFWKRIPRPKKFPKWISSEDVRPASPGRHSNVILR